MVHSVRRFGVLIGAALGLALGSACKSARREREAAPAGGESPAERGGWSNSIGMRFRLVPPGDFEMRVLNPDAPRMPREPGVRRARQREAPAVPPTLRKKVRLTRPFHVGVLEVSDRELRRVLGRGGDGAADDWRVKDHADEPAASVTWEDADEFLRKLSERPEERAAGRRYLVPTEAEWVRAKETATGRFSWFEDLRAPLHWEVRELCADWFDPEYYRDMPEADPTGPQKGDSRLYRVSWSRVDPFASVYTFRVVADLEDESSRAPKSDDKRS